jgi:hypothetical protein
MILLAILGGLMAALALAWLYDVRVRRKGAHTYVISDASRNHVGACQQQTWGQPNMHPRQ